MQPEPGVLADRQRDGRGETEKHAQHPDSHGGSCYSIEAISRCAASDDESQDFGPGKVSRQKNGEDGQVDRRLRLEGRHGPDGTISGDANKPAVANQLAIRDPDPAAPGVPVSLTPAWRRVHAA